MTTVNKALAFTTLTKFSKARVELIKGLRDAGYTLESARPVIIEWACDRAGIGAKGYNVSKAGKVTMNTKAQKFESVKTVVRDVTLMLRGTTRRAVSGKSEPDLVAVAVRAFGKLTAAQKRKFLASI